MKLIRSGLFSIIAFNSAFSGIYGEDRSDWPPINEIEFQDNTIHVSLGKNLQFAIQRGNGNVTSVSSRPAKLLTEKVKTESEPKAAGFFYDAQYSLIGTSRNGEKFYISCQRVDGADFPNCDDSALFFGQPMKRLELVDFDNGGSLGVFCAVDTYQDEIWLGTCRKYTEAADGEHDGVLVVARKTGKTIRSVNRNSGLSSNLVRVLRLDSVNGHFWAGTAEGIDEIDPRSGNVLRSARIVPPKKSGGEFSIASLVQIKKESVKKKDAPNWDLQLINLDDPITFGKPTYLWATFTNKTGKEIFLQTLPEIHFTVEGIGVYERRGFVKFEYSKEFLKLGGIIPPEGYQGPLYAMILEKPLPPQTTLRLHLDYRHEGRGNPTTSIVRTLKIK